MSVQRKPRSHVVKFMEKVQIEPGGCWNWIGCVKPNGYGHYRHIESNRLAHRASYILFVGPIPEGLHLDHLCRNKRCVNPDHLEPVTASENIRRAKPWTMCGTYHPTDPPRWASRGDGRTYCRECNRVREQQRRDESAHQAAGLRSA